ncbi:tryptamine 5-hydroxylase-like [Aristolochia californica]|uniref:tryptamine 5-hydroxylase-like n=1 Tax=Aristolochia californica TaxID=171875 RepID=UPI0035DBAC58
MEINYLQTLLLPLFLTLVFVLLSGRRQRRDLPPAPPKLPIIGHLHLLTDMPHVALADLTHKLGPMLFLHLGRVPTLVVSSPRLAREVLKTHDHAFCSRPQLIGAQYLSFGCSDVTFSVYGPYWRQARKICVTELLHSRRVNSFRLIRREEVARMLASVSAAVTAGDKTDMSERFLTLANDILCRVAFGRRFMEAGSRHRLSEVLAESQALFAGFSVGDFFPGMEWVNSLTGLKRRLEKNLGDLRAVCDEIIEEHERKEITSSPEGDKEDFVDVLLRVQRSPELEVPITDDNLKALVLDMFVAGTDTTSATLEWIMTELARHPNIMSHLQEEVRRVAGTKGHVGEDDLQDLPYLKAVIKETLRLHPPVPLLVPRESIEECTIDGYKIPVGTRVFINTYAMGRDPQVWEDPLSYRPERFVGSSIDIKGQDFELLPFGGGRRGCPGYNFGLATVDIALASLLYHFDWELPEGVEPDAVDLTEIFGLATRKKVPLVLLPRKKSGYEIKPNEVCGQ